MNRPRFTVRQVEMALRVSGGIVAITARKLHCSRKTVDNYMRRHPHLRKVRDELIEELLDLAEAKLYELLKTDVRACIFLLRTRGRDRGYGRYPPPEGSK